jgi:hypothetical protein
MTFMTPIPEQARLVIEAECNRCGPICAAEDDALAIIQWAKAHTVATGHVVILNGTVDSLQREDIVFPSGPSASLFAGE